MYVIFPARTEINWWHGFIISVEHYANEENVLKNSKVLNSHRMHGLVH